MMNDEFYMSLAINEAWKFQLLTYPNPAVGCVILDKNNQILSIKAHEQAGSAHAELNAVITAFKAYKPDAKVPDEPNLAYEFLLKNHANLFKGASAYVSLEPCNHQGKTPPCASLLAKLGFKKVVISVLENNKIASGGAEFLKNQGVEVKSGVCERAGRDLIKPFLIWQKRAFKFFKIALSMNASTLGKNISCEKSRTYTHFIRSKLDLLVIGGNTVRIDRPILDVRLAKNSKFKEYENLKNNLKEPYVCIKSRKSLDEFDKDIELFKCERQVFSQIPKEAKLIMYEGGEQFLRSFASEMDMFLIFQNSKLNLEKSLSLNLSFKSLFRFEIDDDICGFYELEK